MYVRLSGLQSLRFQLNILFFYIHDFDGSTWLSLEFVDQWVVLLVHECDMVVSGFCLMIHVLFCCLMLESVAQIKVPFKFCEAMRQCCNNVLCGHSSFDVPNRMIMVQYYKRRNWFDNHCCWMCQQANGVQHGRLCGNKCHKCGSEINYHEVRYHVCKARDLNAWEQSVLGDLKPGQRCRIKFYC